MTRPRHSAPNTAPLYAHLPLSHHRHSPTIDEEHLCFSSTAIQAPTAIRSTTPSPSATSPPSRFAPRPHYWVIVALVLLLSSPFIPLTRGSALPSDIIQQNQHDSGYTSTPSLFSHLSEDGSPGGTYLKAASELHQSTPNFFMHPSSQSIKHRQDALDLTEQLILLQRTYRSAKDSRLSPSATQQKSPLSKRQDDPATSSAAYTCACNTDEPLSSGAKAGYAIVVPILVILSGIFAGLTLGYMSLDETQLHVLATTGSEKQKAYAKKIIPIRKDGHLLLTTLLIANMITNETLPIVSDPLFPSPVLAVVVSTILVIIFAELVPQSVCSRYGLEIGAFMAVPTRCIIFALWPVGYPVSRILHWTLGPHHGIVYRRAELKELVTMHALSGGRGGDLNGDTVMMVGGALDLQEKVAQQAMTSIDNVFMLPYEAKLDYATLERVVQSGHSRIPIYQEVELPVNASTRSGSGTPSKRMMPAFLSSLGRKPTASSARRFNSSDDHESLSSSEKNEQGAPSSEKDGKEASPHNPAHGNVIVKRKKIIGTLLVKSCVLLDPEDAIPVSDMTINALPTVPHDEPLLNVLNAFQDGRSHMAIVTSASRLGDSFAPSKLTEMPSLARRAPKLREIDEEPIVDDMANAAARNSTSSSSSSHTGGDYRHKFRGFFKRRGAHDDIELAHPAQSSGTLAENMKSNDRASGVLPDIIGVITLEDVLEELIGEEIYDEYDPREEGDQGWNKITPPSSPEEGAGAQKLLADVSGRSAAEEQAHATVKAGEAAIAGLSISEASAQGPTPDASTATPRTLLGRLGLLPGQQRASGMTAPQKASGDAIVSPSATSAGILQSSPDALHLDTSSGQSHLHSDPSPDDHTRSGDDYFNARALSPNLSAPMRETPREISSRSAPSTAHGPAKGVAFSSVVSSTTRPSSSPPVPPTTTRDGQKQPAAGRAIIVRTQLPGGSTQTGIIGENLLLRGRGLSRGGGSASALVGGNNSSSGGLLVNTASLNAESASRSSTPKPSRFKSTPVQVTVPNAGAAVGPGGALTTDGGNRQEAVSEDDTNRGTDSVVSPEDKATIHYG